MCLDGECKIYNNIQGRYIRYNICMCDLMWQSNPSSDTTMCKNAAQTVVGRPITQIHTIAKESLVHRTACTLNCDDRYAYWHSGGSIGTQQSTTLAPTLYWFQMSTRLQLVSLHCFYCSDLYKTNNKINERTRNNEFQRGGD